MNELNCTSGDPDDWFPELVGKGAPERLRQIARQLCAGCPGTAMCLERALAEEAALGYWRISVQGIRGGLTADERRAILASRAKAQDAA